MELNGKEVSTEMKEELRLKVSELKKLSIEPKVAIILVGHNPESISYINMKRKVCDELGILMVIFHFLEESPEEELKKKINELNNDITIHGILIQLPLPEHFNKNKLLNHISYKKDVDGFHTMNAGALFQNRNINVVPCTPLGCMELLDYYKIDVKGMNITVVGTSDIVGLPLSMLLLQKGATVTMCNLNTKDVKEHTLHADMVIACCGVPYLIKSDWVKEDVIIIDIGINRIEDKSKKTGYRLVGDVDFENVKRKCKYITPVPGGIGPMTVISLMKNIIKLSENTYTNI